MNWYWLFWLLFPLAIVFYYLKGRLRRQRRALREQPSRWEEFVDSKPDRATSDRE